MNYTAADWFKYRIQSTTNPRCVEELERWQRFYAEDLGKLLDSSATPAEILRRFSLMDDSDLRQNALPLMRYQHEALELYLLPDCDWSWLLIVTITSKQAPGFPRLNKQALQGKAPATAKQTIGQLPMHLRSYQPFGTNQNAFMVWLNSEFYLFSFIMTLLDELSQY